MGQDGRGKGIDEFLNVDALDFQAIAEGILDGPLAKAVSSLGPKDCFENGYIGSLVILNHVGKVLGDAYGPDAYGAALREINRPLTEASEAMIERRVALGVAAQDAERVAGILERRRKDSRLGIVAMAVIFALGIASGWLLH